MSATRLTVPEDIDMYVTFAFTASAAAATAVTGSIKQGPTASAVTSLTIPIDEIWDITDISSISGVVTSGIDGMLLFYINNYPQQVSCRVSSTSLNLNTRFRLTSTIVLPSGSTWSVQHVSLAAMGTTTGISQDLNLRIRKWPAALRPR